MPMIDITAYDALIEAAADRLKYDFKQSIKARILEILEPELEESAITLTRKLSVELTAHRNVQNFRDELSINTTVRRGSSNGQTPR